MFIFSGPSGCGKSSIIKRLLTEIEGIRLSVSVTTRNMRAGEKEGVDYYFIDDKKFKELVQKRALYEYVDSDFGPKYGTPKDVVDQWLSEGIDVILDLDYPGVQQLQEKVKDKIKTISILPPSLKILRERLINRQTDSMETIERRMMMAEKRVKESAFYDYIVVNDDLDVAVDAAKSIIFAARAEQKNMSDWKAFVEQIVESAC
jgi:guanylate kinase